MSYSHIPLCNHGLLAHSFMPKTQFIQIKRFICVKFKKLTHRNVPQTQAHTRNAHIVLHKCIQLIDKRYIYDMNTKQS